jgi:hypothetical protein
MRKWTHTRGATSTTGKENVMLNRRSTRKRRKFYKQESRRYPGRHFHHLLPRSRGGEKTTDNLLLIHVDRHQKWHSLFGNRSLEEVISLLVRVHRAKGRCLYAKIGLPCRLAPCFDGRPTPSSNGNSAHKATVIQMPKGSNGADAANGDPRVLQHRPRELSGNQEPRSGKGKRLSGFKGNSRP